MAIATALETSTTEVARAECSHETLEYLGTGGGTEYYRCRVCGKVVIEQRGRFWTLRPLPSA